MKPILVKSKEEFEGFKNQLEINEDIPHFGEPSSFPCVAFAYFDDMAGADGCWSWYFFYLAPCENCGKVFELFEGEIILKN